MASDSAMVAEYAEVGTLERQALAESTRYCFVSAHGKKLASGIAPDV